MMQEMQEPDEGSGGGEEPVLVIFKDAVGEQNGGRTVS